MRFERKTKKEPPRRLFFHICIAFPARSINYAPRSVHITPRRACRPSS
ncbi:hypothetical protein PAMC26577_29575 [Caballeronia sordidicola]|uniref:Uncharacterized protein n=1 Tax=Caballeronia sordidicola TaxID=196367 RepID=A0A242MFB3_CABSO|nr:hypothetical protein PAMC26577_29575 [Caballeronia sordidicola]